MDPEVSRRKFGKEMLAMRNEISSFVTRLGWEVMTTEYPVFAVAFNHPRTKRRIGFRFQCDNWDEQPPSLSLFDPEGGGELPWERWPQGVWSVGNPHPVTGKPFLCLPGIREYHIHPSHLADLWDNLKGNASYRLLHLVHRVQQRFGDTNG